MEEAMNLYMEDVVRENGLPAYIDNQLLKGENM